MRKSFIPFAFLGYIYEEDKTKVFENLLKSMNEQSLVKGETNDT